MFTIDVKPLTGKLLNAPCLTPHATLAGSFSELSVRHDARLLWRVRAGSHAYGLANQHSDFDERGIFALPPQCYGGLQPLPNQLSDAKADHVYFSLRRVFELGLESNPSMVEMLYTPSDCVLASSAVMVPLLESRGAFISKALVRAKLGYAMGQIKKARGQNKWINQPQPEQAPTPQQFCYWLPQHPEGLPGRPKALTNLPVPLEHCHVARVEHGGHWYRLYHLGPEARGVFRGGGMPVCESIPLALEHSGFMGLLTFNEQGFQKAQLDHHNYWNWRNLRNAARWQQQEAGELDYDAKNLMHCLRLLHSAQHLLAHGEPMVRVAGAIREELLAVRAGSFRYAELIERAQGMVAACEQALITTDLPDELSVVALEALLWKINAQLR